MQIPSAQKGSDRLHLEREQVDLLLQMLAGARTVPRPERQWLLVSFGRGSWFEGPGIDGRQANVEGDVRILERAGLLEAIRFSPRDGNPTYILTPEAFAYERDARGSEPVSRQEDEVRRFLDAEVFRKRYPQAYAHWSDAEALLWTADTAREFTTVGHKIREALQEFATEVVNRYQPPGVEQNIALVNRRLGAVIAMLLPNLGERRADLLRSLGDYSEATLAVVQRQEHGAQKEGEELSWLDARRVVFHAGSLMCEFAQTFEQIQRS